MHSELPQFHQSIRHKCYPKNRFSRHTCGHSRHQERPFQSISAFPLLSFSSGAHGSAAFLIRKSSVTPLIFDLFKGKKQSHLEPAVGLYSMSATCCKAEIFSCLYLMINTLVGDDSFSIECKNNRVARRCVL